MKNRLTMCAVQLACLLALSPGLAHAQAAPVPETHDMIEALKPSATRSMRNLVVREKPASEAAAPAATAVVAAPASTLAPPATVTPPPAAAPVAVAVAAPAPAPAPSPAATVAPAGPPPSLSLAIQFETNSAQVRPESGRVLGNLVAAMQSPDLKGVRFAIEGHTDARGAAAANQQLSQHRAEEVRLYLIALGVHPARLKAVGKGATDLANPLDPGAAENRRVRVVTLE